MNIVHIFVSVQKAIIQMNLHPNTFTIKLLYIYCLFVFNFRRRRHFAKFVVSRVCILLEMGVIYLVYIYTYCKYCVHLDLGGSKALKNMTSLVWNKRLDKSILAFFHLHVWFYCTGHCPYLIPFFTQLNTLMLRHKWLSVRFSWKESMLIVLLFFMIQSKSF